MAWPGSCCKGECVLVFREGGVGRCPELLKQTLVGAGLRVVEVGTVNLVVSATRRMMAKEAEYRSLVKRRASDGKAEEFVVGGNYVVEGDNNFWTPAEEAYLVWSMVESVQVSGAALTEALPVTLPVRRAAAAGAIASASLVNALFAGGILEDSATLHAPEVLKEMNFSGRLLLAPVSEIFLYFGSQTAFYFAWMNHFTVWLCAPALLGLVVWVKRPADSTVDDDPLAALYSAFVVLWAAAFVAFWKRSEAAHAHAFGTSLLRDADDEVGPWDLANQRRGFYGVIRKGSPVTGGSERYYPSSKRMAAYLLSIVCTFFMLAVAAAWHVISLNLQGYVRGDALWTERIIFFPSLALPFFARFGGLPATVLHVAVVQKLNGTYRKVAEFLTE